MAEIGNLIDLEVPPTDTEVIPVEQSDRTDANSRQSRGSGVEVTHAAGSRLQMTAAVSVTDSEEIEMPQEIHESDFHHTLDSILMSDQDEIAAVTERFSRSSAPTRAKPTGRSRAAGRSATNGTRSGVLPPSGVPWRGRSGRE